LIDRILPRVKNLGILVVLVALLIGFSVLAPNFLTTSNLFDIVKQIATLGICAVGFSLVLITGGIDLSLGYQISVNSVVAAMLMTQYDVPWPLAILMVLVLGTCIGLVNGLIITWTGVAPLIVTLSMMTILNGVSYLLSDGLPIFGFPEAFSIIGQGRFLSIPVALFVLVAAWAAGLFILNRLYFGRYVYAIGNNIEASRLSGVNTRRTLVVVYALAGFFTAIGSIILLSRLSSAQSASGAGFEFTVLTACVLGGVSVMGGRGSLLGAFAGVLIVGVLDNGLILMNVSSYVQLVIKGLILLAAVIYDAKSRAIKGKSFQIGGLQLAKTA
jgi:ribose transport system permease protein